MTLRSLGDLLLTTIFRLGALPLLPLLPLLLTRHLALLALALPLAQSLPLPRPLPPTGIRRRPLAPARLGWRALAPTWLVDRLRKAVAGRLLDFEFNELVPLRVGSIAFGDGQEFTHPLARIDMHWFIHGDIMRHAGRLLKLLARFGARRSGKAPERIVADHGWPAPQAARRKRSPTAAQAGFFGTSSTTIRSIAAESSSRSAA